MDSLMQKTTYIVKSAQISTIVLCIACFLLHSMILAIEIPTSHLDGAFQTASGLFRLDAGQLPGRDFFSYLGIGPILVLFPIFKLFGANLAASGIAAKFVILMVGALSISMIWHLIWRPRSLLASLTSGVVLFAAPIVASHFFSFELPGWFVVSTSPGNSLRPLRAFAPYMLMGIYYIFILSLLQN